MCPKRSFDEKVFKTMHFSIFLWLCANFCWWFERILSAGLSELYFTCPGEHFKRSLILMEKCYYFSLFSDFKQKNSTLLSKFNHRVQRKLPKIFWKTVTVSIFLWHSAIFFLEFYRNFSRRIVKTVFTCSEDLLGVKDFSNRKSVSISIFFRLWAKPIWF